MIFLDYLIKEKMKKKTYLIYTWDLVADQFLFHC